ncbi:MAG: penicillin-binding protein PBP3 [Planctomycetota bacterium]
MTNHRWRIRLLFSGLGAVPVFLAGWLGWVQVLHGASLSRGERLPPLRLDESAALRQVEGARVIRAARGTIVDRRGAVLAIDCPCQDVEAEVLVDPSLRRRAEDLRSWIDRVAGRFADALAAERGPARNGERRRQFDRVRRILLGRIAPQGLPERGELEGSSVAGRAAFFLAGKLDRLSVVRALRELDRADDHIALHWVSTYRRVYAERDDTYGVVGFEQDVLVPAAPGGAMRLERWGVFGIEASAVLDAGESGGRLFLRDAVGRSYWRGPADEPDSPVVLETTLDLEMQRFASRVLRESALGVSADAESAPPQWGALVLIEVETGDVLAMANWARDAKHPKAMLATPYQCTFEPGSVVKPLVFAWALQHAGLDWNEAIDCTPQLPGRGRRTAGGRVVHDDHACGSLVPHDILVNSSNIGAVTVGSLLTRQQWRDYLSFYRLTEPSGLLLPHERKATGSTDFSASEANFRYSSATALSIGYELAVTPLGIARAYLTLLSGAQRELRLYRGISGNDVHIVLAPRPPGERRLSDDVVSAIIDALIDVVGPESETNHPTGSRVRKSFLEKEGIELHGLVAGKTGTAASVGHDEKRGSFAVRNASFVGFAPARDPRYLAVCVMQKDDDARFYGGSYAAPVVVRTLLHALELEKLRRLRQEPQVSASPGGSGWSGQVPETDKQGGR